MVKLRELPRDDEGAIRTSDWLIHICERCGLASDRRLAQALAFIEEMFAATLPERAAPQFAVSIEIADIVSDLGADEDTIIAALLYRCVREGAAHPDTIAEEFGKDIARVIDRVLRMGAVSLDSLQHPRQQDVDPAVQLANVRRMLVGMIDDPRVPVIKLSERISALRYAKHAPQARRLALAAEVRDVFAPLANRLGIGRVRWELEDLAFRYLQPDAYMDVARRLEMRRSEREAQIVHIAGQVHALLTAAGLQARVEGRAKHIYSIWRKMREKGVPFSRVYDVRAVRVVVDNIPACYTALGIVHTHWHHLPHEFDDYIANPKENGYRSIHTAVFGPDGKPLEIQIRTETMHADAELGVCAHWSYKGVDPARKHDAGYEQKLAWLRQVLDSHDESDGLPALGDQIREGFLQEHVYVLTPDGDVLDLVKGATPVDFAYRVHTEVGHRCVAALVDGRNVALNTELTSGQTVEIVAGEQQAPPLDWLNPHHGYVRSSRARTRIRALLRSRGRTRNVIEGRRYLQRELKRFGHAEDDLDALGATLGFAGSDDLHEAVGAGACTIAEVVAGLDKLTPHTAQLSLLPDSAAAPGTDVDAGTELDAHTNQQRLQVLGAGSAPPRSAACCSPHVGDTIAGYFDDAGVQVHRQDCTHLMQLVASDRTRYVSLRWGRVEAGDTRRLRVSGFDRSGLLYDISGVLAASGFEVTSVTAGRQPGRRQAVFEITVESPGIVELGQLINQLLEVSNVIEVSDVTDELTG